MKPLSVEMACLLSIQNEMQEVWIGIIVFWMKLDTTGIGAFADMDC